MWKATRLFNKCLSIISCEAHYIDSCAEGEFLKRVLIFYRACWKVIWCPHLSKSRLREGIKHHIQEQREEIGMRLHRHEPIRIVSVCIRHDWLQFKTTVNIHHLMYWGDTWPVDRDLYVIFYWRHLILQCKWASEKFFTSQTSLYFNSSHLLFFPQFFPSNSFPLLQ